MKKVELLAPAGNFEGLKGALKAGADAIYLGGRLFGARAYADNFSDEELCEAIRLAHIFGKKVYLTINTLVKEKELDQLYDFLMPFYEQGLDGVIVQDLGALKYIKEHFSCLELHASTQMSLTGSRGTALMQEAGVNRIVPARELSLSEMKLIHERTGIEIEAFIHGAMCYCYSGQCLFSSILGGRSGNRGRCAQPCRLTYSVDGGKPFYPLSMRDMCTIDMLPELIEAGIASFKIEGRMKKAAYAAGVTAIYRKYIDLYYENPNEYKVLEEDKEQLKSLYIRSQISEGYYYKHNGKEMLTPDSPAYSGADDNLLLRIEKEYIEGNLQVPADAKVILKVGSPAQLILSAGKSQVCCRGEVVQQALKQPLSKENIIEKIQKSGNTAVDIRQVSLQMQGDVFLPVKALNDLRRQAIFKLEEALIERNHLSHSERKEYSSCQKDFCERKEKISSVGQEIFETNRSATAVMPRNKKECNDSKQIAFHVIVSCFEQLYVAVKKQIKRIYIDISLAKQMEESWLLEKQNEQGIEFFLSTPYIVREKDIPYLKEAAFLLNKGLYQGVLLRNTESFRFFQEEAVPGELVLDHNMYLWNRESCNYWSNKADEYYLPTEANLGEIKELLKNTQNTDLLPSLLIYGRIPMMITANCVRKTTGKCLKTPGISILKDRYDKEFPVYADCRSCYNVIYNSVPLSFHGLFKKNEKGLTNLKPIMNYRLDFTVENEKETEQILDYFIGLKNGYKEPVYKEFTTGHLKRGVE